MARELPDPDNLFNASLTANLSRAIDIFEGEEVDRACAQDHGGCGNEVQ